MPRGAAAKCVGQIKGRSSCREYPGRKDRMDQPCSMEKALLRRREQEEARGKWKSSGKGEMRRVETGTGCMVTEGLHFPAPVKDRLHSPRDTLQAGVGAQGESEPHTHSIHPVW